MGTTKAELTPQGELKLLGSVDTRLPVITDGLVAHYPFDNTIIGENTGNLYITIIFIVIVMTILIWKAKSD